MSAGCQRQEQGKRRVCQGNEAMMSVESCCGLILASATRANAAISDRAAGACTVGWRGSFLQVQAGSLGSNGLAHDKVQ